MQHDIYIAPSILSADFLHLGDELDSIATADLVHYDVMDGHFTANITYGQFVLGQLKKATDLPVDVHLMVTNPEEAVPLFIEAGADIVNFHWEAQTHAHRLVQQIREAGRQAAITLNPATPVSVLESIVDDLDMVLLMSVNPGYGGQKFIESTYAKTRALRRMCNEHRVNPRIEIDGGVGAGNAEALVAAGADTLVAGSGVFKHADRAAAIAELRAAGERGRLVNA